MIPMLLLYYGILAMFFSLVGIRFSKYRVNIIVIQTVIKVYLSYWIILFNFLASFLFINLFKGMDYYNDWLVNIRFNTLDWFMVLVILLVSSCVIVNSIDYLTIMESYLFLVYISLFQFCMITFVLSNDLLNNPWSTSLINGCNLIISQFLVTKLHIHFGFQSFPIFYLLWSLAHYIMLSPFFLVDVYLSLILLILFKFLRSVLSIIPLFL